MFSQVHPHVHSTIRVEKTRKQVLGNILDGWGQQFWFKLKGKSWNFVTKSSSLDSMVVQKVKRTPRLIKKQTKIRILNSDLRIFIAIFEHVEFMCFGIHFSIIFSSWGTLCNFSQLWAPWCTWSSTIVTSLALKEAFS